MSDTAILDKESPAAPDIPRMLGDADFELVKSRAELSNGPILEIGPWLGAVTFELAQIAPVTVVDNFFWSESEANAYPGISEPNGSFRAAFESHVADTPHPVTTLEIDASDFAWDDSESLSLLFYDGPRDAEALHLILRQISKALSAEGQILIKNVYGTRAPAIGAYVNALLGASICELIHTDQPNWCNMAVLKPSSAWADIDSFETAADAISTTPLPQSFSDPWFGQATSVMRLFWLAQLGNWGASFAQLHMLPVHTESPTLFDEYERFLRLNQTAPEMAAVFSVFRQIHHDTALRIPTTDRIGESVDLRLRRLWDTISPELWESEAIDPRQAFSNRFEVLRAALASGFAVKVAGKSIAILGPLDQALEILCLICGATKVISLMTNDPLSEGDFLQTEQLARQPVEDAKSDNFDLIICIGAQERLAALQSDQETIQVPELSPNIA
ncbi:hypothetical protein [Cognatishimia maritima]|uniref:Uncharacterized protein n=1 Tax=Cognatishimia maritima TaxID=870908 RepID=A0A1M5P202_9RHOB|nr:hypothetical protein [Cognatishimia maritima]SHG95768.1 hypothetical protein SAMN04488044_1691 [Cognatishimia maritima]